MNAEMIAALREIETERNISFEMLLEALEAALISAYKRNFGGDANAIVTIDRQTGEYTVYHRRTVVDAVTDPKLEVSKAQAGSRYEPGDFFDEEVTPKDFGRIAAQTAKQVIVQRIREAERDTVFNTYSAKLHDIVLGIVQRYEQRNMYVLLDNKNEALLPFSEQVPR
jgi:N utilization substance protein A